MIKFFLKRFADVLTYFFIIALGITCIIFSSLYISTFNFGLFFDYKVILNTVILGVVLILTIFAISLVEKRRGLLFRLLFLTVFSLAIASFLLYFFNITGLYQQINSIEKIRKYVSSFGERAVILFIIIQFLQVVVLPIPSFVTVGAGVLLFGPFFGAFYSSLGIIVGSLVSFFLGRIFGIKLIKWIVGESALKKALALIRGKDKILFTFMFLFPFFPDDLLCFVAGITTLSARYFSLMIIVVRIITVFFSSYTLNNSLIPFNTWWGMIFWFLFFVFTLLISIFIYKKSNK